MDAAPLAHSLSAWWAIAIGALGSLAYLLAAFAGFIGNDAEARSRILTHFKGGYLSGLLKVAAFGAAGGGVAMVFQLTEHFLVPVQAFILGCTWPAVVANYLSDRQQGSDSGIERKVADALRNIERLGSDPSDVLESLPEGPEGADEAKEELEALIAGLPQ